MININELGLKQIRREIETIVDEEKRTIIIFNPLGDKRKEILNLFIKETENGYEGVEDIQEPYIKVLRELTNLSVDEDLDLNELFDRPSLELIEVRQEINNILSEIQLEFWYEQLNKIDKAKELYLLDLAVNKTIELQELTNK